MALFMISYDLNKTKNYPLLWDALKEQSGHRILESVWLLNLNNTSKEVLDWLKTLVDDDDSLVVTPITKATLQYTRAKAGTNDWLSSNG